MTVFYFNYSVLFYCLFIYLVGDSMMHALTCPTCILGFLLSLQFQTTVAVLHFVNSILSFYFPFNLLNFQQFLFLVLSNIFSTFHFLHSTCFLILNNSAIFSAISIFSLDLVFLFRIFFLQNK